MNSAANTSESTHSAHDVIVGLELGSDRRRSVFYVQPELHVPDPTISHFGEQVFDDGNSQGIATARYGCSTGPEERVMAVLLANALVAYVDAAWRLDLRMTTTTVPHFGTRIILRDILLEDCSAQMAMTIAEVLSGNQLQSLLLVSVDRQPISDEERNARYWQYS